MVGSTDAYQAEVNATTKLAEIQSRAKRDIFRIKCFCYTAASICMVIGLVTQSGVTYGLFPKEMFFAVSIAVGGLFFIILALQPQDHLSVRVASVIFILVGFVCGPFACLPNALNHLSTSTCANTTLAPTNSVHGAPADMPDLFCSMSIIMWAWQIPGCFFMGAYGLPMLRRKNGEWVMTTCKRLSPQIMPPAF